LNNEIIEKMKPSDFCGRSSSYGRKNKNLSVRAETHMLTKVLKKTDFQNIL